MKCPNMGNETVRKFRSNTRRNELQTLCENTSISKRCKSEWNFYFLKACTYIGIIIQHYIWKTCNNMLVKNVHIDRNAALRLTVATLYIAQFPLRLTAVLSDQRQASFHKHAPLHCASRPYKMRAYTMYDTVTKIKKNGLWSLLINKTKIFKLYTNCILQTTDGISELSINKDT
jgi:hypothetical protein